MPLFCSCLGLHNRAALDPELTHCLNALSERVLFSGWLWLCTFPVFCPVQTNISSLGRALCCKLTKMQEKFSKIFSYSLLLCIEYIYTSTLQIQSCPVALVIQLRDQERESHMRKNRYVVEKQIEYHRIICALAYARIQCVSTQVFVGVSAVCSLFLFKHKPG